MAVGIGLVFGVLRLVNFAYGQLIMAGAYTLAYTSAWPLAVEHRRLLRRRHRALARHGARGLPAAARAVTDRDARDDVRDLVRAAERRAADRHPRRHDRRARVLARRRSTSPIEIAGVDVRKVTIVAVARRASPRSARSRSCSAAPRSGCARAPRPPTSARRACSACKANQVIGLAVVLSGALAAAVAVILTVQTPFVTPDFALHGHDHRARRRGRRRHRPPLDGHARRLRDRLHHRGSSTARCRPTARSTCPRSCSRS